MGNFHEFGTTFLAACEQLFAEPLFRHGETEGGVSLLLRHDDPQVLRDYLVVAATGGQTLSGGLRIQLCGRGAREVEAFLARECPLYGEFFQRRRVGEVSFTEKPAGDFTYVLRAPAFAGEEYPGAYVAEIDPARPVSDELQRLGENLHYAYCLSYDEIKSLSQMMDELHHDPYNYASSILQAVHLPVKLYCCGIDSADLDRAAAAYEMRLTTDRDMLRRLVYLEHVRWSVFLALTGWNIPTRDEMEAYAFQERNSKGRLIAEFRHREKKLHPSLVECSLSGVDALSHRPETFWDEYDPEKPEYAQLDPLSQMSLWQHVYARKIAVSQRQEAREALNAYREKAGENEATQALKGAIDRLEDGRATAPDQFRKALETARDYGLPEELLSDLQDKLASSIEATRRRSYLQGDFYCARTMGFVMMFRSRYKNLVAMLGPAQTSIAALAAMDPEQACFLVPPNLPEGEKKAAEKGIRCFIEARCLRTQPHFLPLKDASIDAAWQGLNQALSILRDARAVCDLTGASPAVTAAAAGMPAFLTERGRFLPFRGCETVTAMNDAPRHLRVTDLFAAMGGRTPFEKWKIHGMGEITRVIGGAFQAYLKWSAEYTGQEDTARAKDDFTRLMNHFQREISQRRTLSQCNEAPAPCCRQLDPALAAARNVAGCLSRLEADGFVEKLTVTPGEQTEYAFSSRYPEIAQVLFDRAQPGYSFSAKSEYQPKIGCLRPVLCAHPERIAPPPADLQPAMDAFVAAGCLERAEGGYRFVNAGVMGLFRKHGNLLEDYIFTALRRHPGFRDVELSYSFGSVLEDGQDHLEAEIDVIGVTGENRPVFLSCKLGQVELKDVKELYNHTRNYPLNRPIPVLVASCPMDRLTMQGFQRGGKNRRCAEEMGVIFLDREVLADPQRLQDALTKIAEPKCNT